MRTEDLKIANLTSQEQVEQLKGIICDITGARFVGADLSQQIIEFDMVEDLDDLDLTTVQCELRAHGFEAGEVVEGQTCSVRFRR
jgi:hypothetical protein